MSDADQIVTIGLADHHGTIAEVAISPPDAGEDQPYASLSLRSGSANLLCSPSAMAWRQLAAASLDAADAIEGVTPTTLATRMADLADDLERLAAADSSHVTRGDVSAADAVMEVAGRIRAVLGGDGATR